MTEFETGDRTAELEGAAPRQKAAIHVTFACQDTTDQTGARAMAKKSTPKSKAKSKSGAKPRAVKAAKAAPGASTKLEGTVFTHPSPSADTQRTVASTLGEIVWLMSQSANHKTFFISDLEWMIMVPVMLQQFRIFYDQQKPIGVALWGFVNDEVEARLAAGNMKLKPQDWKSGEKLWVAELIAPFGEQDAMMQDLKSQVFPEQTINFTTFLDGKYKVISL